jgi:pyruvate,water dikinase
MSILSRMTEGIQSLWIRLSGVGPRPGPEEQAAAREVFRARYRALRLLLSANTRALNLMAEMERAAAGERPLDMAFVRSRCTAVGVAVFRMIRQLNLLADGKYASLFDRHEAIQAQLREVLEQTRERADAPLVVALEAIDRSSAAVVGAKMSQLGEVRNVVKLPVPDGFVATARAQEAFFRENDLGVEIDRLNVAAESDGLDGLFVLSSRIRQAIVAAELPGEVREAIESAYDELCRRLGSEPALAVRSSALDEDAAGVSFAGQYHSVLNVRRGQLLSAYREVIAGMYSAQAIEYRRQRGLRDDSNRMCVGFLTMIDGRSGGVAYTGDPVDPADRDVRISASLGLPVAVVDGRLPTDTIVVSRDEPRRILEHSVATKEWRHVCDPQEGVAREQVPETERRAPALTAEQALSLADRALRLEAHFGSPQDVEWVLDREGRLLVLQSRPLQQVARVDRESARREAGEPLLGGGLCVSPGVAAGPVCWVRRESDAMVFPEGAVLVLPQPLPRYAALLGRAVAVVSERGGVAGHLATVARELGRPAVFSAQGIERLREGQVVTVDADGPGIWAGRVEPLLALRPAPANQTAESPIRQTLASAMRWITPLELLDPEAPDFRADRCRTLHDITRFCHEMAVKETFDAGRDGDFPHLASKQLHHNVRMQWWLLDLNDGFVGEIRGKYVKLEQIACEPFHALWKGMLAIPWEGPPAVDGRGFAAVLFEATANPALGSPLGPQQPQGNYFLVSRQFMNLQARFGAHFCVVEALAGERAPENYVSFSFKGGAADESRKEARARFVGDLLEGHGFVVEQRGDLLGARADGLPRAETLQRVQVVGYLLMHTRQLDMVMANPSVVASYRKKMRADLETLR